MLHRLILWITMGFVWTGWTSFGAQTFVAFGLTNTTLGNATFESNQFYGFIYSNLGTNGTDGVSIDLGEADSGVFVSPSTDMDPAPGTFMAGSVYGSVNGQTNRLIGSMRCHEEFDGHHPVAIDFSPLGPTHLTFLAFRAGRLVAQTGPQEAPMVVYGTYFTPYYPRVNPFWRAPDGSIGALIEFTEAADVSLPGVGDLAADRIFIRADNPTNTVDFTSRLEITAWLPYFSIYDERLGMFRRPHRAMGNAHLHAEDGTLEVTNLGLYEEDGLLIELATAIRFDLAFAPIQLNTNGQLNILATSSGELGDPLGSARLARPGESLELSARLENTTNHTVVVLSNGVPMGTAAGTNVLLPASATVTGHEVHSRFAPGQSAMVMRLGAAVTVTLPDLTAVQGDEIRFLGGGAPIPLAMIALNATGLEEFTIVSETEHPLPAPELQIVRSGNQLELSWIDPYRVFGLEAKETLEGTFYSLSAEPTFVGDRATVILQIDPGYQGTGIPYSGRAFFRLSSAPLLPARE